MGTIFPFPLYMFTKSSKGKGAACVTCGIVGAVHSILAVVCTVAAVIGVYKAHFLTSGAAFGTTSGSLSILALIITLFFVKKCAGCCSCQTK